MLARTTLPRGAALLAVAVVSAVAHNGQAFWAVASAPPRPARVTKRPPDPKGHVLILMYHRFGPKEANMVRSLDNFRDDLRRLYRLGYRPVTMTEYVENRMPLPPGASPVVLTFDDSPSSQFAYRRDGKIDPATAVGVWREFARKHPDFPVKGVFYVLPNGPFGDSKTGKKKVSQILAWGGEIGSHTMSHRPLSRLSDDDVKRELVGSLEFLQRLGVSARTLALPYGIMPKNGRLVRGFEWKGRTIAFNSVVWAGASPAPAPGSPRRRLYEIPRVKAYGGTLGIKHWLARVEAGKSRPYVAE
jgi:peptidoglycan/xylan/chitin deacetylase (PgdA/CDA1 family)